MTATEYSQLILDALRGETTELRALPPDRLDWSGTAAVLRLYRETTGADRTAIKRAMSDLLGQKAVPSKILAQLVNIASGLDVGELEPAVRGLQRRSAAADEPLRRAVANYLEFRKLASGTLPSAEVKVTPRKRPAGPNHSTTSGALSRTRPKRLSG
jgi:hypothetical protein